MPAVPNGTRQNPTEDEAQRIFDEGAGPRHCSNPRRGPGWRARRIRERGLDAQSQCHNGGLLRARARFQNPSGPEPWDYGFVFRLTPQSDYHLYVRSTGEWRVTLHTDDLDIRRQWGPPRPSGPRRRAINTIELVALVDVGVLAINGTVVEAFDISALTATRRYRNHQWGSSPNDPGRRAGDPIPGTFSPCRSTARPHDHRPGLTGGSDANRHSGTRQRKRRWKRSSPRRGNNRPAVAPADRHLGRVPGLAPT